MKFCVIGGGITGVSTAYQLAKEGEQVTLYERSPRLGGLVGSFKIGNVWLEKYFHHIFLSDKTIQNKISEVGLEKDVIWKKTPMGFYSHGKLFPFDGPLDLLQLSPLPFFDRLKFGRKILATQKMHGGINLDSISAKEWVEKEWSPAIYQNFWGPLLKSKFSDSADEISAAWLWGRIYARANSRENGREQLGYLKGGFIRLMEKMGEAIQSKGGILRLQQDVKRVEKKNNRWVVSTDFSKDEYDVVIFTVPSPYISPLCPELPEDEKKMHDAIQYVSILCMPILTSRPFSKMYWINVADPSLPFTGMIEHTNYIPKEEYGGEHITYLFNYLPQQHPWLAEPKSKLFERYEVGLQQMFRKYKREHIKQVLLFRDLYANVIYYKDYLKKMPPMASKAKGIFYANTSHIFPQDRNQNFSIELANRVLEKIRIS